MKILRAIYTLCAAALLLSSCQDEEMIKQSGVKEGIPVTIDLTFSAVIPEQEQVGTRATTDPEHRVNDLYILIFNANTRALKSNENGDPCCYSFNYSELTTNGNTQTGELVGTLSNIKTTTGESVIYAIANAGNAPSEYGTEDGAQSFDTQIRAIQNIDDLKKINAKLHNNETSNALERNGTTRRFLMSGSLDCMINADNTITVAAGDDTKIPLYRTDSRIVFNIAAGGEGTNCTEFTLLSFQVCKVPSRTSLVPLTNGTIDLNYDTNSEDDTHYWDTESGIQPNEHNKITFYVPENIKYPRGTQGDKTQYAYRETWIKGDKGERIFTNAPDNGTYVILHGIVEGTVDESNQVTEGTGARATVDYIIHLGDWSENNYTSFSNKRNVEYTYNITVNGVDDIVVEVEQNNEREPGAEGDVFFQDGQYFDIDSPYEALVMTFTSDEIHNTGVSDDYFTWRINSPFEEATADVAWLRFVKNDEDHENTVMPYPGDDDENLMTLTELMNELKRIRNEEPDGSLTVTCFVDEYVYDVRDWSTYTNVRNREAYIFGEIKDSPDGNSSTIHTKYVISQRSIQTPDIYYGGLGLGIETLNETGDLPMGNPSNKPTDHAAGYDNMTKMLGDELIQVGTEVGWGYQPKKDNKNEYEYSIPENYQYAAYACLLRNRDANGDGKIEGDEIKWYLPAVDQYTAFYIGLNALSNDARFFTGSTYDYEHYFSSSWGNGENAPYIIWAEEGIGTQVFNGNDNYGDSGNLLTERKRNYRCIRNLGTGERTPFYEQDSENPLIITINHQRNEIYRDWMVDDNLGHHNERHANNQLYQRFQVSEDYLDRNDNERRLEQPTAQERNGNVTITSTGDTWDAKEIEEDGDPCSDYYENSDRSDIGSWRMPNQRELLVMMTASGVTNSTQEETAILKMNDFDESSGTHQIMGMTTYSFYNGKSGSVNKYRYFVQSEVSDRVTGFIMQLQRDRDPEDAQEARQWRGFIRCVRDVVE